jgi:hypothetical protein
MNISAELVAIAIGILGVALVSLGGASPFLAYPWLALDGRSHPISDMS